MDTRSLDVTISGVGTVTDSVVVVTTGYNVGPIAVGAKVKVGDNVGVVSIAVGAKVAVGDIVGSVAKFVG